MPDTKPFAGWHLDKRVSLGHIVTTLTVAGAMVAAYADLRATDERLTERINAETQARQSMDRLMSDRLSRTENRIANTLSQIRDAIVRIEDKLDEKADR